MTEKISINDMVLVALFIALITIGAFMSIPVGPVSVTLQTLFVMLSGFFLGRKAFLACSIYVIMGLLGLPVFAGFQGGISYLFKPSFGFLIGMIFASIFVNFMFERLKKINFINSLIIFLLASLIIYLFGVPYMSYIINIHLAKSMNFREILSTGMIVFIPGDILKCIAAASIVSRDHMKKFRMK